MNFEAMHAISNSATLNTHQKLFLITLCMNSKRDNYDEKSDTIKNITISNITLMKKMSCGKTTVYETAKILKEEGILVSVKDGEYASNNYVMMIAKIKQLTQHERGSRGGKVIHRGSSGGIEGSCGEPGGSSGELKGSSGGPNNNTYNKIYNNNYKGSYFLKNEFKIQNLDHAKSLLTEKIDLLEANKELPIKYGKSSLIAEVIFHLQEHPQDQWSKQLNICIDLIKKQTWDIPTKLKIQREQEAIAREMAAQKEKQQELEDMRNSGVIQAVFGSSRSTPGTARNHIQEMMAKYL